MQVKGNYRTGNNALSPTLEILICSGQDTCASSEEIDEFVNSSILAFYYKTEKFDINKYEEFITSSTILKPVRLSSRPGQTYIGEIFV